METSLANDEHTEVDVLEVGAGTGIFLESALRVLRHEAKRELEDPEKPVPAYLSRRKLRILCTEPHAPYVEHMKSKYPKLISAYNKEVELRAAVALAKDWCPATSHSKAPFKPPASVPAKPLSTSKSVKQEPCDTYEHLSAVCPPRTDSPSNTSSDSPTESSSSSDSPADANSSGDSSDSSNEGASISDEEPSLDASAHQRQQQHQHVRRHQQLVPPLVEARVLEAPAESLPLGDSQAKAVLCASSLHWFCNDRAFREMRRVLVDNGVLGVPPLLRISERTSQLIIDY